MRTTTLIFALILAFSATDARGQDLLGDGNDFLRECKQEDHKIYCLGFVTGSVNTYNSITGALGADPYFCPPAGNDSEQLLDAVTQYLNDRPDVRRYELTSNILAAMSHHFPCDG